MQVVSIYKSTEMRTKLKNRAIAIIILLVGTSAFYSFTTLESSMEITKSNMEIEKIRIDFETLKKASWNAQETENVKLVIDFVQHLMNDHDFVYVKQTFGNDFYKQHNRGISDGMDALIEYVAGTAKRFPEYTYDVKHIYADGNYVVFHSHATIKAKHRGNDKKGLNIVDTWRIEDGSIVEHWDALQSMNGSMRLLNLITGGKIANSNGVY